MAGRQDAKTEEQAQPTAATIVAAWIIQGLLLGSIAWLVCGEPPTTCRCSGSSS
ncbi:MAG TPA: hypothetical protein VKY24_25440 [Reyranella sp.]|nr:hypothetical protein [Reyranella sp.]